MKDLEKDKDTYAYIESLVKTAKRCNAGTALASMKNCGKWDGASVFILVAAKDADKFQIVQTLVDNLGDDEE